MTNREKVLGTIIAILSVIIVFGVAYFASELKYCKNDVPEKVVELPEIGINEYTTLLNGDTASIVYVARPTCYYCQQQEPIVKDIVGEYDLVFHYLNTDELSSDDMKVLYKSDVELFGENGDQFGTPTTLVVKKGKVIDSVVGLTQKDSFLSFLKEWILSHIAHEDRLFIPALKQYLVAMQKNKPTDRCLRIH